MPLMAMLLLSVAPCAPSRQLRRRAARGRTNRSKDDFLSVGADEVRHTLACKLHRFLALPAIQVRAAVRVAELLHEERQHGVEDTRVDRCRSLRRE
jgi:hypothetical protein